MVRCGPRELLPVGLSVVAFELRPGSRVRLTNLYAVMQAQAVEVAYSECRVSRGHPHGVALADGNDVS